MQYSALTFFFYGAILIIVLLSLCILYLVFVYRRLLEKYTDLSIEGQKKEVNQKIKIETSNFVNQKVNLAVEKATEEAVSLISKNAKSTAENLSKKTVEKLIEEEKGEEQAVAGEFNDAKVEIEKYKSQELEKIRKRALEILEEITPKIIADSINRENQEKLIISELENAKRNKFF